MYKYTDRQFSPEIIKHNNNPLIQIIKMTICSQKNLVLQLHYSFHHLF